MNFYPNANGNFALTVARGLISNIESLHRFGYNASINTTEQPVWAESAVSYAYPSVAATVTASSSSASDTSAGTGARTIYVEGLNSAYAVVSETITLNGTTAVTSANSYLRINRMYALTAGSGGTNAGIVYIGTGTVTTGKPAVVLSSIVAGAGESLQAIYTVPASRTAYIASFFFTSSGDGEVRVYQRRLGAAWRIASNNVIDAGQMSAEIHQEYASYPEKTDIEIRAISVSGNIKVSAEFEMLLVST